MSDTRPIWKNPGFAISAQFLLLAQSFGTAHCIRNLSSSLALDLCLLTLLTVTLMLDALILTSWVTRLLDTRTRRNLESLGLEELGDAFTATSGSSIMRSSFVFVVILSGLAAGVDGVLLDDLSGYYQKEGRFHTLVRAGNTPAIGVALEEMASETLGPDLHHYVDTFMMPALENKDLQVFALRGLWITGVRMGRSLDLIQFTNAESGGWEKNLFHHLREDCAPRLRELLGSNPPEEERALALEALGSFRGNQDLEALKKALGGPLASVRKAALRGLSQYKGNREAARILVESLRDGILRSAEDQELALFAFGEVMMLWQPSRIDTDRNEEMLTVVKGLGEWLEKAPPRAQCVGVTSLRKARLPSCGPSLFKLFKSDESVFDCPPISLVRPPLSPQIMATHGEFRFRILDAISLMAVGNDEVGEWLTRLSLEGTEGYSRAVQEAFRSLDRKLQPKKAL